VTPPSDRGEALRLLRYLGVGSLNTTVHLGGFAGLLALRVPYAPADAVAYAAGVIVSYLMNHRYTFRVLDHSGPTFARFVALQALLGVANVGATIALVAATGLPPLVAQALVLVPLVAMGFVAAGRWVFRGALDTRRGR
jgi:putative flippase GtrA